MEEIGGCAGSRLCESIRRGGAGVCWRGREGRGEAIACRDVESRWQVSNTEWMSAILGPARYLPRGSGDSDPIVSGVMNLGE